ncbi:hypothetical protein [Pontibacter harenae]|uniref:hypothetical protein n=1 Tax=Pontibacter harenae TaxID=2894083 RepID=UPI001E2C13EC|nr:hypothetical protein [Pontibacter harenae]MCC9167225.1 hypothetical protein [Pontibacter harenae]
MACHDEYKRTNGRSASGGTTKISPASRALNVVNLSNRVANEAKAAAGIISTGGGNITATGGGNIIATGGLN